MYLLKMKYKENPTATVNISLNSQYYETKKLTDAIRYLFDNACFIKHYEIFKIEELEKEECNSTSGNFFYDTSSGMRLL